MLLFLFRSIARSIYILVVHGLAVGSVLSLMALLEIPLDIMLKELKNFIKERITNYSEGRNFPNIAGTSKLSPFIKFGQLHVETIWDECIRRTNRFR